MRRPFAILTVVGFLSAGSQASASITEVGVEQTVSVEVSRNSIEDGGTVLDAFDDNGMSTDLPLPFDPVPVHLLPLELLLSVSEDTGEDPTPLSGATSGQTISTYALATDSLSLVFDLTSTVTIDDDLVVGESASGLASSSFSYFFSLDDSHAYSLVSSLSGTSGVGIYDVDNMVDIIGTSGTLAAGHYELFAATEVDKSTPGMSETSQVTATFTLGTATSTPVVPEPSTYLVFGGLMLCFGAADWWRKRRQQAA